MRARIRFESCCLTGTPLSFESALSPRDGPLWSSRDGEFLSPLRAFVTYRHAFCLLGRLHNIVFVRFSVIMVIHFEPAVFSSTARPFWSATRISLCGFVFVFHRRCRLHMLNTYRRATVFGRPTIMASITVCRSFRQHSRTTRNASRKKQT